MPQEKKPANTVLSTAIAVALSGGAAKAQEEPDRVIDEIIVTATKRSASMQDIAVSVQAMTGDTLEELGVRNFDEYSQFLSNVVQSGRGPGQKELYIRGAATEQSPITISSVQGSSPSVALYQDEQPVSFGGRNLDIYATDLERIEVLPGPQGMLFGASSQSGTLRLITNKPRHDGFEAGFDMSYGVTAGGEDSASVQAYINIPITENLAARVAAYTDSAGGWIDNVPGIYQGSVEVINRQNVFGGRICTGDLSVDDAACGGVRATMAGADNSTLVEKNFNDATYRGARFGLSYQINDNWNLLLQHTAQTLETDGVFEYDPNISGTESVQRYTPNDNQDEFGLTAWTLTGRMAALEVVYTGGFLDREVFFTQDYSRYTNRGPFQAYYICAIGANYASFAECFDPTKQYIEATTNERLTNELRFSTDEDNRWHLTAGVFFDHGETTSIGDFHYAGAIDAGFNVSTSPGTVTADGSPPSPADPGNIVSTVEGVNNPYGRGPGVVFANDFSRREDQLALFGVFSFDLTDTVSFDIGARNYDIDYDFKGASGSSFGCKGSPVPCDGSLFDNNVSNRLAAIGSGDLTDFFSPEQAALIQAGVDNGTFFVQGLESDGVVNQDGGVFRATISWKANDDLLLFGAYAEGFRPQTVNRDASRLARNQTGAFEGYLVPAIAKTDELENFEIGFKGDFFDNTLRFSATAYSSKITDLQISRYDPVNIADIVFIENVGDAEVDGLDADFGWVVTENLTISGAFTITETELSRATAQMVEIVVPVGSDLPFTPDFSGNLRARYDFPLVNFNADAYVQASVSHRGDSKSGFIGDAYVVEDITALVFGGGTSLTIVEEGGFYGAPLTTEIQAMVTNPDFIDTDSNGDIRYKNARYVQESYTLLNLATGVMKDHWVAELFISNVTDEAAQINVNKWDGAPTVTSIRPRTIGLRFSYDFE